MSNYQKRLIAAILVCCILVGIGTYRSVQVANLRTIVADQALHLDVQSQALHARSVDRRKLVKECRATITQVWEALTECDYYYNKCMHQTTADSSTPGQGHDG